MCENEWHMTILNEISILAQEGVLTMIPFAQNLNTFFSQTILLSLLNWCVEYTDLGNGLFIRILTDVHG